jgi:hypothetical protein
MDHTDQNIANQMQSKLVAATFHGGSDSASLILIAKN